MWTVVKLALNAKRGGPWKRAAPFVYGGAIGDWKLVSLHLRDEYYQLMRMKAGSPAFT